VIADGGVPLGIGAGSVIKNCIVDKNARIGKKVTIANKAGVAVSCCCLGRKHGCEQDWIGIKDREGLAFCAQNVHTRVCLCAYNNRVVIAYIKDFALLTIHQVYLAATAVETCVWPVWLVCLL